MTTRTIIFMIFIGFFSINTNATPHEDFIKKVPAFLLLVATQCPNVICKAIESSINSVSDSDSSNLNSNIVSQLWEIEQKIKDLTQTVVISSFIIMIMVIFAHATRNRVPV